MDAFKFMARISNKSVDCLITDPPYGIDYQSNSRKIKFSKLKNDDNLNWLPLFVKEAYRILKENTHLYCFCRWDVYHIFYKEISKLFSIKNCLILKKRHNSQGDLNSFSTNYEMCIYAQKGKRNLNKVKLLRVSNTTQKDNRYDGDGWIYRFPALVDYYNVTPFNLNLKHPTEKTIEIIRFFVLISTGEKDLIIDPFIGSGTTAVACKQTNRNFIGCDIDQEYVDIANKRLNQSVLTSIPPTPLGVGILEEVL